MGAGVALRSAPQLWCKSLERSLMQRASDVRPTIVPRIDSCK